MSKKTISDWEKLATKEVKADPSTLIRKTPEGINIKPLYTSADMAGTEESLPGFAPFTRGPRATMYAGREWTIRQYAGFSTAEESNAFYRTALAAGQRASPWPSIWPRIAAMIPIIRVWLAMLAKRALRLIPSKI